MNNLFDACKGVSALEAAEKLGVLVKRKGRRAWVCCPIHHERTPSLCFYEDGGWHCFGCRQGGDSIAFYAAYLQLSQLDAAKRLAEDFHLADYHASVGKSGMEDVSPSLYKDLAEKTNQNISLQARELMKKVEAWKASKQRLYADIIHIANNTMRHIEESLAAQDLCWDNSDFSKALYARQAAEDELDILSSATPKELFQMMKESGS